jgi:hypothetical protein
VRGGVPADAMTRIRLVENDVQGRVACAADQLQTLVDVLIHNDGHAGDELEDGWHWDSTVIHVVHENERLPRGFAVFPLMLGDEFSEQRPPPLLERQRGFHVQVPLVFVQRRYHRDIGLPRNPPTLLIARAFQEIRVALLLDALSDAHQQPLQRRISRGAFAPLG